MLSRRRSAVFSRKGSMLRSRESKLGLRGAEMAVRVARVGGAFTGKEGEVGSWWRKEVRR